MRNYLIFSMEVMKCNPAPPRTDSTFTGALRGPFVEVEVDGEAIIPQAGTQTRASICGYDERKS